MIDFAALLRSGSESSSTPGGRARIRAAYAQGLEADYAAVQAGLQLAWSNTQRAGQLNKLMLIKRQMGGCACRTPLKAAQEPGCRS